MLMLLQKWSNETNFDMVLLQSREIFSFTYYTKPAITYSNSTVKTLASGVESVQS